MGGEFGSDVEDNRWARILIWCRLENLIGLNFRSVPAFRWCQFCWILWHSIFGTLELIRRVLKEIDQYFCFQVFLYQSLSIPISIFSIFVRTGRIEFPMRCATFQIFDVPRIQNDSATMVFAHHAQILISDFVNLKRTDMNTL